MSAFTPYKTLVPYVKRYWRQYCGGLLCLLAIIGGQLLIPQFIRLSIDTLTAGTGSIVRQVAMRMVQLVGITLIIAVARFGWRHFLAITARKIETELRHDVYANLTTLSHDFYAAHSTGDIIARLTNDLRAIRMACGFAIVSIVDGLVMGVAIIILLLVSYPQLTIYMLAPLPLVSLLVFVSGKVIVSRYAEVQRAFSTLTENARHALTNMRTIKAYGKERYFGQKFHRHADDYKRHSINYARFWSLVFPSVLFLATSSNLLLIIFGGREVISGRITIGDFAAIMTYLEMLLWPMVGLGFTINLFAQGAVSLKRINEFLHASPLIRPKARALPLGERFTIEVNNMHYAYPSRKERVLTDISLTIADGAHIGIIGRIASGKSTLVQLLPRLLEAPPHSISIDGKDIRGYSLQQLRQKICLVTQRPFLFSESIEYNIGFGRAEREQNGQAAGTGAARRTKTPPNGDESRDDGDGAKPNTKMLPKTGESRDADAGKRQDAEARQTAELFASIADAAAIDANSPEFPDGFSTEIGENGIMISGGQKQRIAIARALIADPPVLIFDDTFSALDADTEQRVMRKMRALRKNKSTVFVSNRVKSLEHCDEIYVLSEGAIIQQGDYRSLIDRPGLFQDLYYLQIPTKLERP